MSRAASSVTTAARRLRTVDYRRLTLALGVGTAGGTAFALLGVPLAWMLGAAAATCAAALARWPVAVPAGLRTGMLVVLGIMLGSAFHPALLDGIGRWTVSLAGLVPYVAVAVALAVAYLRRFVRYDPATTFFAATPGGFNHMVIAGTELGGDSRVIALSHSVRILMVVFALPALFALAFGEVAGGGRSLGPGLGELAPADAALLAACALGWPMAARLGVPAAALIGPMLLSGAVHLAGFTASRPPAAVVAVAQVVVGAAIGARFAGADLRRLGRVALAAVGLTALLLAVNVAFAWAVHRITGLGLIDLILAYAPGGVAEMSLIALALGTDAAFVSTHHVARIVLIVAAAPAVFAILLRRGRRDAPRDGDEAS